MHDGPGVRTVVFLAGCPLRCAWCHNPEGQSFRTEILFDAKKCIGCAACAQVCPSGAHRLSGTEHIFERDKCTGCMKCAESCCAKALEPSAVDMTEDEIVASVEKDVAFYGEEGGVTLSGGEPFAHPTKTLSLLKRFKERGIGTAVETSGYFDAHIIPEAAKLTDLFLWDFKDGNDERHTEYTKVSNEKIKANLLLADKAGAKSVMRCIMVNGVNMQKDHYDEIGTMWKKLSGCLYAELLPYHAMGGSKMLLLGLPDNGHRQWIPTEDMINEAKEYLRRLGVTVK